jgi:hypothetical protein
VQTSLRAKWFALTKAVGKYLFSTDLKGWLWPTPAPHLMLDSAAGDDPYQPVAKLTKLDGFLIK